MRSTRTVRQRMTLLWRMAVGCTAVMAVFAGEAAGMTGNEYRDLPTFNRTTYVIGVIDGWEAVWALGKVQKQPQPTSVTQHTDLARCVIERKMTQGQTRTIVDKYIENHPADWQYRAAQLVFLAMDEACKP